MANDQEIFHRAVTRRGVLAGAVVAGAGVVAGPLLAGTPASAAPIGTGAGHGATADPANTPSVNGLHLQFGADAAREIVISWHTLAPVALGS